LTYFLVNIEESKKHNLEAFSNAVEAFLDGESLKKSSNSPSRNNLDRLEGLCYQLSTKGWYLDNWKTIKNKDLNEIQSLLYGNLNDNLDALLMSYFQGNVIAIFEKLQRHYPDRKHILSEVQCLLEDKRFHGFITLALSLVDGMSVEVLNKEYFKTLGSSKGHKLVLTEDIVQLKDLGYYFLLRPIVDKTAISDYKGAMSKYKDPLNRHEILHGKNTNYGTEVNAIKVLSFMAFTDMILRLE
jgi:hypothetical protein